MTTQMLTGLLLLVLPVAYNLFFTLLARTFDYPDILRRPTAEVLARFAAGGSRLVLIWWGFAMSAVLLAPAVVLVSASLADAGPTVLALATATGLLAALVQFLGLVRWPFAVPHLARLAADPAASPATGEAVAVTFQTLNRYLGVAVGGAPRLPVHRPVDRPGGRRPPPVRPAPPPVRRGRAGPGAAVPGRRARVRGAVRAPRLEARRHGRPPGLPRLVGLAAGPRHRVPGRLERRSCIRRRMQRRAVVPPGTVARRPRRPPIASIPDT
jgi:hypothetical protein